LQHRTKLSLEDDGIDLKGLAEVAAKENNTLALLHNTVQQLHARRALYTATEEKQLQVTRLSAQLAWAELAQADRSVTAVQQQLTVAQATLHDAQARYADMQHTLTEQQQAKANSENCQGGVCAR
jgi:alkylated DNA repair dioxygenase AlkB